MLVDKNEAVGKKMERKWLVASNDTVETDLMSQIRGIGRDVTDYDARGYCVNTVTARRDFLFSPPKLSKTRCYG